MSLPSGEFGYSIFIVIIFIIFLVIAITWSIILKTPTIDATPSQLTFAGYSSRCLLPKNNLTSDLNFLPAHYPPSPCAEGLTCVQNSESTEYGICKVSTGELCTSVIQCVPGTVLCNGICLSSYAGGLNQEGPCIQSNLIEDSNGICKLIEDSPGCHFDADCLDSKCNYKDGILTCIKPRLSGSICTKNYQCNSNNCSFGYCQPDQIKTGEIGALCNIYQNCSTGNCQPTCNSGLSCYKDLAINGAYNFEGFLESVGGATDFGVCTDNVYVWPENQCSSSSGCIAPSVCWNGVCIFPRTIDKFSPNSCVSTATQNSLITTGKCINGYYCDGINCIPKVGENVPYKNLNNKYSLFQWDHNGIGEWKSLNILLDTQIPIESPTLTSLVLPSGNLIIYQSITGFQIIPPLSNKIFSLKAIGLFMQPQTNNVYDPQPNILFTLKNISLTPAGGILVGYSLTINSIVIDRGYLFESIPVVFLDVPSSIEYTLVVPVYTNTLSENVNDWFQYPSEIILMSVDDIPDAISNMRLLLLDLIGNLYIGLFTIDFINGNTLENFNIPIINQNIIWAQLYSYSQLFQEPLEYVYKQRINGIDNGNLNIKISVADGNPPDITIPPSIGDNIIPSQIITQSFYSPKGGGLGNIQLLYLVDYPEENGGTQLRLITWGLDVVMPGYFSADKKTQLSISNVYSQEVMPVYFIITLGS